MKRSMPNTSAVRRLATRLAFALALSTAAGFASTAHSADPPYYYIVNTGTQMMAEVLGHALHEGAPVVLWPHYGGASQQFSIERFAKDYRYIPIEEEWFMLRVRHSGKCLRATGYHSGAPIQQSTCSGTAEKMWRVRKVAMTAAECANRTQCFGGTRLVLENYYDRGRRCLDAANGAFPAPPVIGTGLQAWDCIAKFSAPNAINQEWELVKVQDWNAPGPVVR